MSDGRTRVGYVGPLLALDAVREALGSEFDTVAIPIDAVGLRDAIAGLEGLVEATTRIPLDAGVFAAADRLRIVSIAGTGDAHVDRSAAAAHGVEIRTLVEDRDLLEELDPTAELTWGLLLACARRIHAGATHVVDGGWEREQFPGMLLAGRRLGIVGLGRLGRKIARYGAAFGMDVVAHDPYRDARWPAHVTSVALEEVFATADVISVHVPLDASTTGLVDRRLIGLMRPDAILVNTSRGAIVDEDALVEALQAGRIGGAALDVLRAEPPAPDDRLVALSRHDPRLLITPHLGGYVPEVLRRVCAHAASKVRTRLEEATR
jgi:phosphoglycerate dehydrogenase-like enzyme